MQPVRNEHAERLEAVARAVVAAERADWGATSPAGRQAARERARELLALLDVLGYAVVRKA